MSVRLDESGLDDYTDRFQFDALRHETLTGYDVASDGDEFARYLDDREAGPDLAVTAPWGSWVQAQRRRGATVRRVRVLFGPPSDYLRFELDWIYPANQDAGEDIRILDLVDRPDLTDVSTSEFWMLDGDRAALMNYDDAGRFVHADTVEGDDIHPVRQIANRAWREAEPLDDWWARHPHYRRAHGRIGA